MRRAFFVLIKGRPISMNSAVVRALAEVSVRIIAFYDFPYGDLHETQATE